MNAGDLCLRRLRRLKWAVQGLTALFLVAIEAYYYFIRRVPFVEDLVDWLIGMAIAGVLIEITFRAVANVQSRLQREITERQRVEEALRKAHDELELRVKERTAELAKANEALRAEITERVRAEEELRQSYAKSQRALEGTVNVLVSAIEMRDPYTTGHQRQVTQLACAIAHEMDLPEERIEGLRMAGLIHDMGKISIPAEILAKPGILSDLEYGLIRSHAQVGYDILNGATELPWPVADIVLQHHERMDGSGYPQGLSGEEIMLEARILAVADVVAAMASHRPYRPALGLDEALEDISQNRGILYDPEVVDVCLRLFTEKGFAFE